MRLDKYLTLCGLGSRSEVKKIIASGGIEIDGVPARRPETDLSEDQTVTWDGEVLEYRPYIVIALNKPAGYLTATRDAHAKTVLDLIPAELRRRDLSPAGRLDRDTTGLLLLTDRGDLVHRLIAPKHEISKIYLAELDRPADDDDVEAFARGLDLGDFTALPATLELLPGNEARVTVHEGKYHQVKRMFEVRGKTVLSLHREAVGPIPLPPELSPGEWRFLTKEECKRLFDACGMEE